MRTLRLSLASALTLVVAATAFAALDNKDVKKLNEAATVLAELRDASDVPDNLWDKAQCVIVIPDLKKAGFIVGGEFGSGVMSCRQGSGWSAPIFMDMAKGSAGFQIGASSTDLVLLVMNRKGADKLLANKVTLGTDASIAAGPVGRQASAATDAQMTAEMLSYSRSKGLFAGINLSGGSLSPDKSANERAYGANASAREIVNGTSTVTAPPEAIAFTNSLSHDVRATSGPQKSTTSGVQKGKVKK